MTCNVIKKETVAQVFSCEICEISKNTFFTEHIWTTASMSSQHFGWDLDELSNVSSLISFIKYLAGNYMFKVNNRNTRTRYEICSKVNNKDIVNFWAYFTPCSSVSIVNFEHLIPGWVQ